MKKVVVFAAGGTAGHVEPALATAQALRSRNSDKTECRFIGTTSGIENSLVVGAGFRLDHISKVTLPRKISVALLLWPFRWLHVLSQTYRLLHKVDLLIGFGGYVSAPCYVIAKLLRIPILIHEQNAKPGWGNRLGSFLTNHVAITFESARSTGGSWRNATLVGLPLRATIRELAMANPESRGERKTQACRNYGLDSHKPVFLVFGGSLGAERINQSLAQVLPELLSRGVQIIHGVGKSNKLPDSQPGYLPLPYIDNMADAYAASDLVMARSGAATCIEISAVQNYAVLVPLAIGNGEQRANAAELVSIGAAEILDNSHLTGEWLTANIDRLIATAAHLREHRTSPALPDSATLLADMATNLLTEKAR